MQPLISWSGAGIRIIAVLPGIGLSWSLIGARTNGQVEVQ